MRSNTLLFAVLATAVLTTSCQNCGNMPTVFRDTGNGDGGLNDGGDVAPEVICTPGELVGCREENTPAIDLCNADGTGTEPGSCPTSPPNVCRGDECVEVACLPNTKRCVNETTAQVCNDSGSAWLDPQSCGGSSKCELGNCLNRCQLADITNSYIGCEYWAVELDNALLNDGNVLPPDRHPPFAIVLANTSTEFDAQISVYTADGEFALADFERTVGADIQFPGDDLVTVHSEVVDQNGVRLLAVAGRVDKIPLPRQSIMTLVLPRRTMPYQQSTLTANGYRVVSTQPVVAYQFNPLCCNYNFTNDASLLLPTSALTENYTFLSYEVWKPQGSATSYASTLTVVGTQPNTTVNIKMRPSRAGVPFQDILYPSTSAGITGPNDQGVITATLQPFEVLNLGARKDGEDLTGATITASQPVAVFGGHTCAYVPDGLPACDHLESQLFPVETWGRRFIAAPLKIRGGLDGAARTLEGTYFKFVALEDQTEVQTGFDLNYQSNPNALRQTSGATRPCRDFSDNAALGAFTLDAGESCVIGAKVTFVAESGKPLMVGAFLSGQGSVEANPAFGSHNGDPAFFLVPPEEQYRSDYSFLTPTTYFVSYVTVLIQPGFTVSLDGQTLDLTQYDYELLGDHNIARAHIPVRPGPHFIESQNQIPFGIVVYGYDDYVSYAFTGGLDLTKLNIIDR